jgi:hypothetical protein
MISSATAIWNSGFLLNMSAVNAMPNLRRRITKTLRVHGKRNVSTLQSGKDTVTRDTFPRRRGTRPHGARRRHRTTSEGTHQFERHHCDTHQ